MRFLIDENVRKEVTDFLKSCGHDVLIVPSGSEDKKIAKLAKDTKRILLTHDKHFADILVHPPKEYSGIIPMRIHPPSASAIINSLEDFLPKVTPSQLDKKLIILELGGFRIRG